MPSSPSSDGPEIRVTNHALKRARERHADLRPLGERELLKQIGREVGQALREGRFGRTAPAEARHDFYTRRSKAPRTHRFAWTASHHRFYVFKREAGIVLVLSVMSTSLSRA